MAKAFKCDECGTLVEDSWTGLKEQTYTRKNGSKKTALSLKFFLTAASGSESDFIDTADLCKNCVILRMETMLQELTNKE